MRQHRAFRRARGAASVLQQREVGRRQRRPGCGRIGFGQQGQRAGRILPAPARLGRDQCARHGAVSQHPFGLRHQRCKARRDQQRCARVPRLLRQLTLRIQRREMHHPRAGAQRGEEADGMPGRVGQQQRDAIAAPDPARHQPCRDAIRQRLELAVGQHMAAILQRRRIAEARGAVIQEARQRAFRDGNIPARLRRVAGFPRVRHQPGFTLAKPLPSAARRTSSGAGCRLSSPEALAKESSRAAISARPRASAQCIGPPVQAGQL